MAKRYFTKQKCLRLAVVFVLGIIVMFLPERIVITVALVSSTRELLQFVAMMGREL